MLYGSYLPLWQPAYGSQPNVTGFRQHLYQITSGKLVWPSVNGPIPAAWPALPANVRGFYTIYPNPDQLLAGQLDSQLHAFISSAPSWGGVLTAYAEADANASSGGQFAPLGLTQDKLHQVHAYIQAMCRGTTVRYGSVMCGCGPANAAFAIPGLDFYALDWYDTWSPELFTALNQWRQAVGGIQESPVLAIAETNSNNQSRRPWWFSSVYAWLQAYNQGNGGGKGLGFWSYWNPVGQLSGPWVPTDTATIGVLDNVAADALANDSFGYQSGWQWCHNCEGMFFGPHQPTSVCPAGGAHDGSLSDSYLMVYGSCAPGDPVSWCNKCQGMFSGGGGACPAGGPHDGSSSWTYWLASGSSAPPGTYQGSWARCGKCSGQFYGPHQPTSNCPAGGTHSSAGSLDYWIGHQ